MSGTVEDFDGLCGIIAPFASSDLQLKCQYELGHSGDCSWEKYRKHFQIRAGITRQELEKHFRHLNGLPNPDDKDEDGISRGFIDSVLAEQEK